jgi:hypothetical protein
VRKLDTGLLIGSGTFSEVYADPKDPDRVQKATACEATARLLRALIEHPVPGLPKVYREVRRNKVHPAMAQFSMERLFPLAAGDRRVPVFRYHHSQADRVAAVKCLGNARLTRQYEAVMARIFAELVATGGASEMADLVPALRYLSRFLRTSTAKLDLRKPGNLMVSATNGLVLSDPVMA